MKIPFTLLLVLSLFRFASAQDKSLSIELAVGPTLADKFVYYDGSFHDKNLNGEGPVWSFEGAIRGLYSFSDRWSAGLVLVIPERDIV